MSIEDRQINTELSESRLEIDELITVPPGCLLHSGIMMIGLVTLVLITLSVFIKYPEKIVAAGILTSDNPPIAHYGKSTGIIKELYVENEEVVDSGQKILYIQNNARRVDIEILKEKLNEIRSISNVPEYLDLSIESKLILGNMKTEYAELELILNGFKTALRESGVFKQISTLQKEIKKNKKEHKVLTNELELSDEELRLKKTNLDRYENLKKDGAISDLDYEDKKLDYLSVRKQNNNLSKGLIQNEIRKDQLQLEIHKLTERRHSIINDYVYKLKEVISQLEQKLIFWEERFYVKSTIRGIVSLPSNIIENKNLLKDDLVATIVPDKKQGRPYARVECPPDGIGKVAKNQRVIIKFDGYPYKEFGTVTSKVGFISAIPTTQTEGKIFYEINIPLIEAIETDHGMIIPVKPNATLIAEIITQDKSILGRIFEQFTSLNK